MPTIDNVRELTLVPFDAARERAEEFVTGGAQRVGSAMSTAVGELRERAPDLPFPRPAPRPSHTRRNVLLVVIAVALLAVVIRQLRAGRGDVDDSIRGPSRVGNPTSHGHAAAS